MASNEKEKGGFGIKNQLKSRYFRAGSYSILASVIVIAIVITINIVMNSVPTQYTKYDITSNRLYEISDESKNIISGLTEDVEVFWIVRPGFEDPILENLLENFASLNEHFKLSKKDPDVNPGLVQGYAVTDNSVLVKKGDKTRFINEYELNIYEYDPEMYYQYYGEVEAPSAFDGERQIIGAIDYVCKEYLPKMYLLSDHGELTLSQMYEEDILMHNFEIDTVSLITSDNIPEDADIIFLDSPLKDITEEEKNKLIEFIDNGGDFIVIADLELNGEKIPNIQSLLQTYGISLKEGVVCEGDEEHTIDDQLTILPIIGDHEITNSIKEYGYPILIQYATGIEINETLPLGVEVTPLLYTTEQGYIKSLSSNTIEYIEGDEKGVIPISVAVSKDNGNGSFGKIVVIGTSTIADDYANSYVAGSNEEFFINVMEWMTQDKNTFSSLSINSKQYAQESLIISDKTAGLLKIVFIGTIPLVYIIIGIVIVVKRRRR